MSLANPPRHTRSHLPDAIRHRSLGSSVEEDVSHVARALKPPPRATPRAYGIHG